MDVVEACRGSQELEDAAQIWAEATAFRDGESEIACLSDSLPIIEAVLDRSPQAFVLLARADGGSAAGFAAVEPITAQSTTETTAVRAEVAYIGVRPSMWGRGVAQLLLRQLQSRLTAAGYTHAELSVYAANVRAVTLYERLGWQPVGAPTPHRQTGKPEQRYELVLEAALVSYLPLPQNLVGSIASSEDPQRRAWLDRLPGTVRGLARDWGLELGAPFQPGGQCSWVAPAHAADGARLVLKVEWLHPEAEQEAAALRFWDGNGAVRLHADAIFGDTIALLLERCEPGTLLSELAEPEQDVVVCTLLPRLWREPAAGHGFPSLQAMCAAWADETEEAFARAGDSTSSAGLDRGLARAGLELFRTLPVSADRDVLLATDLHAENVLAARREPWLAIDPKPHVGDPVYDALQHMLNCDRLFTEPAGLAWRLADLLELQRDRMLLWLFARVVQESPGQPALGEVAVRLAGELSW